MPKNNGVCLLTGKGRVFSPLDGKIISVLRKSKGELLRLSFSDGFVIPMFFLIKHSEL